VGGVIFAHATLEGAKSREFLKNAVAAVAMLAFALVVFGLADRLVGS
jgi:hypothetical protein